jgi:hypothetical protein
MQFHHVANIAEATSFVNYFAQGDTVLVKASRAEHFELLAQEIRELWTIKVSSQE